VALYLEHFGLKEPPFRITPHTDFFFTGAERGATLEALIYAVLHDEGIVKVSGEVGSGKTMLCRVLMERLPSHVDTIYLATPSLARDEILEAIGDELGLALSGKRTAVALRELQEHLIGRYGEGRRVVILIDEAHAMPGETLEEVRLLSNLESSRHKLLQIVLFGQPELDVTLAQPGLRPLRDRVTHAFRMRPLSRPEAARYVSFRMRAAGYRGPEVFTPRATALLQSASGGLTRRLNILADKALLSAFTESSHAVIPSHVRAAVQDSEFAAVQPRRRARTFAVGAIALAAGLALGLAAQWIWLTKPRPAVAAADAVPVSAPQLAAVVPPEPPPAQSPQRAPPYLSAEQAGRLQRYSPAGHRLLAERIAAARAVLDRAPDDGYSIELFTTDKSDPGRMERFLVRARDFVQLGELFIIPIEEGGLSRLRVVYGEFPTRDQAAAAEKRLPPRYQEAFRTELRSFSELRSQI